MDTSLTPEPPDQVASLHQTHPQAIEVRNNLNGISSYPKFTQSDYPEENEESLNLREIWRKIRRRKWLILSIVLLVTAVTTIQVLRLKSIYQATATIEIGKDNPLLIKTGDVVVQGDDSDIQTALFLLRSRPLLEDVVANLKLDQNQKFTEILRQRPLGDVFQSPSGNVSDNKQADSAKVETSELKATDPRDNDRRLTPYINILRNNINVEQIKGARLISISFNHTDPEMAATVATGIAQHFIERHFRKKTQKYSDTSAWLDTATRRLETQMREAEQELANYTRDNGIYSTTEKEDLSATKLAQLHSEVMKAESDRLIKESLYEEVKRGHVAQLPEAFANISTGEFQKKLSELNVTLAQLSVKFDVNNPRVVEVRQQIAALEKEIEQSRRTLEEKLKADYERAVRDHASLTAALNRAKSESLQQNQKAIQFNVLKQNVETSRQLYTNFLQKTSQANVEEAEQQRSVSIAEPAEIPTIPVSPLRARIILFAFVLSLAAGIGLVFLLDHLDNTMKSVEDVSRYAHLPTLGLIPAIRPSQENGWKLGIEKDAKAMIGTADVADAYRTLRTSVLLSAANHPPKTILVTSSRPAEGKTTTVVNTAVSLAQLGLKVLVIDADLRRPRIHRVIGIDQHPGLSAYLSSDVKLESVLRETETPNLWVICAGMVPPNPAELVSSEKMRLLLRQTGTLFDHILIDTPPVLGVSDSVILSRLVDGVMLVVQGGKSTREMVRQARQELVNVGAKIFGVVLNNINLKREGYDQYYYRYRSEYKLGDGN